MRKPARVLFPLVVVLFITQAAWAIAPAYRVYQKQVPAGSPAPTELSRDSGWTLVKPNNLGVCAIGGSSCAEDIDCTAGGDSRDKCVMPPGTAAEVSITCDGNLDIYIAYTMVFDSGVETRIVSTPSEPIHCLECPNADSDGDGYCSAAADTVSRRHDCDDGNRLVYPGARQTCDGLNNDCDDPNWPTLSGTNAGLLT